MTQAVLEQDGLVGEVEHPQIVQKFFRTQEGMCNYVTTFNITHGGFAYGDYPEHGLCWLLEYPYREQA